MPLRREAAGCCVSTTICHFEPVIHVGLAVFVRLPLTCQKRPAMGILGGLTALRIISRVRQWRCRLGTEANVAQCIAEWWKYFRCHDSLFGGSALPMIRAIEQQMREAKLGARLPSMRRIVHFCNHTSLVLHHLFKTADVSA